MINAMFLKLMTVLGGRFLVDHQRKFNFRFVALIMFGNTIVGLNKKHFKNSPNSKI